MEGTPHQGCGVKHQKAREGKREGGQVVANQKKLGLGRTHHPLTQRRGAATKLRKVFRAITALFKGKKKQFKKAEATKGDLSTKLKGLIQRIINKVHWY